ncbi:MAG: hypothetical protein JJE30_14700 [Desulfuromonadales bacterium]|nr:hypothetical protein [Desulfuromonadales bacterium]
MDLNPYLGEVVPYSDGLQPYSGENLPIENTSNLLPTPPPTNRSALGEIWSQLKAGAFSDLPRMAGQTMKYISNPGNNLYDTGQGLVESADAIASLPEMQAGDTTGRPIVNALSQGARMLPQSIAPALGAGLVLSGVGAPAGLALIGGSALAAAPAGMAQAQDTFEKGLAKHGLTPAQAADMPDDPRVQEVTNAARMTGSIEFGGETAGGALAGRFLGIGGGMAKNVIGRMLNKGEKTTAQTVLRSFTNPGTAARFGVNALETATGETAVEMGQGYGESAVEKEYGYDTKDPWQAAKETVAPTLGMSALLLPFGIPAHASHAVKMKAITSALENPATPPEARSQAAEIIYNELAKSSPDAAANFAAHSFDAIHGYQDTGSVPYGLTLDDSALNPLTPRALQTETEPSGPLSRALSTITQTPAANDPQPMLPPGATDLLNETSLAIQSTQPAAMETAHEPAVSLLAAPTFQERNLPESTPVSGADLSPTIPTDSLHKTLQHFIKRGQEKTGQTGQALHVWDKPNKTALNKAVSDYLQPATGQGLVSRDPEGGYNIRTDQGGLRIVPPSEPKGNYRIEYHNAPAVAEQATTAPLYTIKETTPGNFLPTAPDAVTTDTIDNQAHKAATSPQNDLTEPTPVIERQAVETAFPGQTITLDTEGYTVTLKSGAGVKISTTGEISFDVAAAEAAYGRKMKPGERPVASFQQLNQTSVISLTEKGVREIHHETFHAAMALALNEKQRSVILQKFGTEEAAATEYQRLRDSGAFKQERRHHLYLQMIYNFFSKIRTMLDPAHGIMKNVATGKVWETPATQHQAPEIKSQHRQNLEKGLANAKTEQGKANWGKMLETLIQKEAQQPVERTPSTSGPSGTPVKYSLAGITDKTKAAKDQLAALANKSTFVKQDVQPAMKAAGEGLAAAWDGIKAAVNPMDRSAAAEETGRILIEGMGRMEHGKEKFITSLNKATMQGVFATTRLAKALDLMQTSTTLADKLFARMTEAQRIGFMQNMDTGQQQATKELQQVATAIKTMFEEKAKAVQTLGTGALETVRDNYFPHVWDRSDDARKEINTRLSRRPLEGSKGFTKVRIFEDINAGIEAGFKLVDTNPINLVFLKMAEMDKYLNAHIALQAMEESGLVELIPAGEKMPDGYGDISGKYGMVTKRAHQDPATGEPGELKSYRYVAREDVAQVFNNYLSSNLYDNKYLGKPFTAYMKAANTLNQFQLGVFSAFHAGFTSMEAVISHAALGIKALTRGDFKAAATYFKHAPAAWYLNPKLGDKVMKAWMGDEAAAREMPQIIHWLEMAGARRIMDSRFQTDQTQKMFQAWSEGNKIGAGLRTIPAIVEQSARPILEWLVPRQKFGVFAEMMNDWSRRNPTASHEATRKAAQHAWNRVDSRLGQVVYDRLFVHNVAKNLTQAIVRAPGWSSGTVLEVGGGFKDLTTFAKDLATKGKKAELTDRAAYTLSLLVTTALANAILTAAFTGEPPQDWKDLLAFRTGKKDEKGNPERFMLPTYMKDVYAYAQKPGTTLMNKTHPLISLIGDLANNKDYYGTEIRHQGDNPIFQLAQAGEFTAKAFIPFWMKGAAKEFERGGSVAAMAAPLIGVMPAPADLNKTEAERLASKLVSDRMPKGAKTQAQFERSQLVQHLTSLTRRDPAAAAAEIAQARQERKLDSIHVALITKNARLSPIQVAFKRLSYEEAMRVFEVATEAEKKKLLPMLAVKRYRQQQAA